MLKNIKTRPSKSTFFDYTIPVRMVRINVVQKGTWMASTENILFEDIKSRSANYAVYRSMKYWLRVLYTKYVSYNL